MKSFRLATLAGVVALAAGSVTVFAASDVLVPSDNETITSPSYLGLVPAESDAPSDQAAKPVVSEKDFQPDLPNLDPSTDKRNYTPLPPHLAAKTPSNANSAPPVQTINMPVPPATSTQEDSKLPGSLRVSMAEKNKWGQQDLAIIQRTLGINTAEAPQHCALAAKGTARSDGGAGLYSFDINFTDAILHYEGKLKDLTLRMHALCDKVPLPATARYIMVVGDKYSVSLSSQVSCDTPPENAQSVTLQYLGDGVGKCVYK